TRRSCTTPGMFVSGPRTPAATDSTSIDRPVCYRWRAMRNVGVVVKEGMCDDGGGREELVWRLYLCDTRGLASDDHRWAAPDRGERAQGARGGLAALFQ